MLIRADARALPLSDASIDACVTDPPYGIGFMGREWDTFKPGHRKDGWDYTKDAKGSNALHAADYDRSMSGQRGFQDWTAKWAAEVFRVLKPGAYLVVCGAPRSHHRMMCGLEDAGFVVRDCFAWLFGSGFPKNYNLGDGKGTALKPAHEPIALAWKPFKGSIKACHQQHGTAALNIDACRLDVADDEPNIRTTPSEGAKQSIFGVGGHNGTLQIGRWPANVLLDEEAATVLDTQTGELQSGGAPLHRSADKFRNSYGTFKGTTDNPAGIGSSAGGASRFYYVAKPSREERDYGCERNGHPTVKPVELMRWLVRLVVPLGGVCLDPFTGSGTTGMACRYELRGFVGIEREAEYIAIAERRISAVAPLFGGRVTSAGSFLDEDSAVDPIGSQRADRC